MTEMGSSNDRVSEQARKAQEFSAEATAKAKDTAAEMARSAADKAEESRRPASDALHRAAKVLHHGAEWLPGRKITGWVNGAAKGLEATGRYVEEHDTQAMLGEVKTFVKRYPSQALLVAAAFGLLVGLALRRE